MPWPIIAKVQHWLGKRQRLLEGLVGVAVEEAVDLIPGARLAVRIVGEVAKHGVERLARTEADIPDLKPSGQTFPTEQLDQINAWLETLTTSYGPLLDRLEALPVKDEASDAELTALVKQALDERQEWRAEFDAHKKSVCLIALSLSRIEEKLDVSLHVQQQVALGMEEIKVLFVEMMPLLGELAELRQAQPDALQILRRADEHFLAGRRDQGTQEVLGLLRRRGVGQSTLCRLAGLRFLSQGDLNRTRTALEGIDGASRSSSLTRVLTGLNTASTRGGRVPVWRSLPRGFLVSRKYLVEAEVGRGGMASVYRCTGASKVRAGEVVAVKVPAPWLMADTEACRRFVQEIEVSLRLSEGRHPAIVRTLGYEIFDDPHTTGRELYGLVLEYIDGLSLAQFLAQRQAKNKPLDPKEIVHILKPLGEALAYAHVQGVYHRDVKPPNVMLAKGGHAKLMDFGIARVLEDGRATLTGQADVGTPVYMPPDRDFDVRSDIYLLGNLLLELLTFDPRAVAVPAGCPPAWAKLVADAMNRFKENRPQTVREFLDRLEGRTAAVPPPPPPPPGDRIRELIDAERYEEAMAEYRRLPHERRRPALLKELQDKWREHAHALARDAAETDADYAAAVALVEKLPEALRDGAVLADYRAKRDRLAQLRAAIDEDVENHRHTFRLRNLVAEYRRLKPDDPAINELHQALGDVPREIVNSLRMKLVLVPGGTFWMGDRGSQTQVQIPRDFYLGAFPVTQEQWQAVMGSNPSYFTRGGGGADKVKGITDADLRQFPVEQVSWDDVQEFLKRLNAREKDSGFLYRLPTEAEWEYSCRGGAISQKDCAFDFYFSQPTNDLSAEQANFDGNHPAGNAPKGKYLERTSKVGSYKPNRLGIYDMHGNVWEWCEGHFEAGGSARVLRGGCWFHSGSNCRASLRFRFEPSFRINYLGVRLAAVPSGE